MMEERKLGQRGFTLVELIVVIAILGVLAAVLVPQYIQYVAKSKKSVCLANQETVLQQIRTDMASQELSTTADILTLLNSDEYQNMLKSVCPDDKDGTKGNVSCCYDSATGSVLVACKEHSESSTLAKVQSEQTKYAYLSYYNSMSSGSDEIKTLLNKLQTTKNNSVKISSADLTNANSTASQLYATLSTSQKKVLDQYAWVLESTSSGPRFFLVSKTVADSNKGTSKNCTVYKYDPDTQQFQYSTKGKVDKNGNVDLSSTGSDWGADVNGSYSKKAWSSTMPTS